MSERDRAFDIVVWGASGYTGRLTAEYLLGRYGVGDEIRWAIGGRNRAKLESVRKQIGANTGVDSSALPIVLGDSDDPVSLRALAEQTRVVCTTVGPYAKFGSGLVAACANAGTDYCDLAGEVHWMRAMIGAHQQSATANGARIIHSAGFDCIPSDLGVFFLQRSMQERHGVPAKYVKLRVVGFSGTPSGGTIASMETMIEDALRDPEVRRTMADPYALNPAGQGGPDGSDRVTPVWDSDFEQWTAPFIMAALNSKVVRRSNALLDHAYGEDFRYDEATLAGSGPLGAAKAAALAAGLGSVLAGMAIRPIRRAVVRHLPQPGEGPTREQREDGWFDLRLFAAHPTDPEKHLRARIRGDRDPGYGSTSKMLGESAVCLAKDTLEVAGGFFTPASAMGDALLARLPVNAGVTFELEDG
ncbi:MAG: saccharopine dehydrogenase NADP-binding domain-containing protein [Deltaproteobacteria bacterium]|nr:saccharopine dehydrogenase NADP-binding domain-containing protein [Deltaproteobacteria bacterium]